jgi:hypothetical protein
MRNTISGNSLRSDIERTLANEALTDKDKLERIQLATDLHKTWNAELSIKK